MSAYNDYSLRYGDYYSPASSRDEPKYGMRYRPVAQLNNLSSTNVSRGRGVSRMVSSTTTPKTAITKPKPTSSSQAYPVFLFFTCKDLLDTHQPYYWTWSHFIPRFFVYIGILFYFRLIWWIRILCNPITQKKVESWAFWMTFPLISFWISLVIQQEWILASILLIYLICNASAVEYIKRKDDLPISSHDYDGSTTTTTATTRSNSESSQPNENQPLLIPVQSTSVGVCVGGYHT